MSAEISDSIEPFDAAAVAAAVVGTWSHTTSNEPTGVGYVHFTADGRLLYFVYDADMPERRIPARMRYAIESASTMRITAGGDPKGSVRCYRFEDEVLVVMNPNGADNFRRVAPEEVPAWFAEALGA